MCRAFGSIIRKEDSHTPYFRWLGGKTYKDLKLIDYGDNTIFSQGEIVLIEGICENETMKVIKCHKPKITSNQL